MRLAAALVLSFVPLLCASAPAYADFSCAQIPEAQRFLDGLKPGPNTRAAQRHLDAAKAATSDKQCIAELRQVDRYARRSAAADERKAARAGKPPAPASARHPVCADWLHQNRPGGSDYHGPPVPGCPRSPG